MSIVWMVVVVAGVAVLVIAVGKGDATGRTGAVIISNPGGEVLLPQEEKGGGW